MPQAVKDKDAFLKRKRELMDTNPASARKNYDDEDTSRPYRYSSLGGLAPAAKSDPRDVNLPDPQKGKVIGRSIHGSSNHIIHGGDSEDPRWASFFSDRMDEGSTKDTVNNIVGEIRRRQKTKLRLLGDKD